MTTNEFYYLLLVCGSFFVFGVTMMVATVAYHRSLRRLAIPASKSNGHSSTRAALR